MNIGKVTITTTPPCESYGEEILCFESSKVLCLYCRKFMCLFCYESDNHQDDMVSMPNTKQTFGKGVKKNV